MNDLAEQTQKLMGIGLTRTQMSALDTYERELLTWNAQYNLTAIDEPERDPNQAFSRFNDLPAGDEKHTNETGDRCGDWCRFSRDPGQNYAFLKKGRPAP